MPSSVLAVLMAPDTWHSWSSMAWKMGAWFPLLATEFVFREAAISGAGPDLRDEPINTSPAVIAGAAPPRC